MTNGKLTYGELFEGLRQLGYRDEAATIKGKPAIIFDHPEHERATIFMPKVDLDEEVWSMHVLAVRTTLTDFGLITHEPARELMDRIAAARAEKSSADVS